MPRIYAPVLLDDVVELIEHDDCRPRRAFGVTSRLRETFVAEDQEGLEHLATQLAAAAAESDPVTVAVFETSDHLSRPHDAGPEVPPGLMEVTGPLRRRDLVCFLVADKGAQVTDEADLELSWYDAAELSSVRALLAG